MFPNIVEYEMEKYDKIYLPSTTGNTARKFLNTYPHLADKLTVFTQDIEIEGVVTEFSEESRDLLSKSDVRITKIPTGYANYILGYKLKNELRGISQGVKVGVELGCSEPNPRPIISFGGDIRGINTAVLMGLNFFKYASFDKLGWTKRGFHLPELRQATFFVIPNTDLWGDLSQKVKELQEKGIYSKVLISPQYDPGIFEAYPRAEIMLHDEVINETGNSFPRVVLEKEQIPLFGIHNYIYRREIEKIAKKLR